MREIAPLTQCVQRGARLGETLASYTVLRGVSAKELGKAVVRHLVHQRVAHGRGPAGSTSAGPIGASRPGCAVQKKRHKANEMTPIGAKRNQTNGMGLGEQLRGWGGIHSRSVIDGILAPLGKVVCLLDLVWPDTLSDPDHPEELVDIVAAWGISADRVFHSDDLAHPEYPRRPPKMTRT